MGSYKREKTSSFASLEENPHSPLLNTPKGKMNSCHRTTSSPNPTTGSPNGRREKGVIEKLLNSYGFVECVSDSNRVFFHYSEYNGDPNQLNIGGLPAVESLSEEACIGRVEVEPKISRKGEHADPSTFGRVSYDKNGEFFFLPFTYHDIEKGEQVCKGDAVTFSIATNKRTGSLKARRIKYFDLSKQAKCVQGIVSSLKESFGFIERADVVAEIFFHYSEYDGNVNELMIGDDVEFQLQDRQGKEIAVKVKKLASGTVVFEDISTTTHRGHVIKSINTRALNNSVDGHLTGMIEYQGKTDTHEVLFGDRDTEDDIILQKGDVVEFNVSTDRRDKLERAVNIKLISVCVKDGQKRDFGVLGSLKDGFGFIKCAEQDLSIFFHFSEVLEQSHIMNLGDEVEFTIETDPVSQRQHATRIRFLPKGTVTFETISTKRYGGVLEQEAPERNLKSPSKVNRDQDIGVIKSIIDGEESEVYYRLRDCRPREVPCYLDKVDFILVTKKSTQHHYARDICVLERNPSKVEHGFICALKDSYGFIEVNNHEHELFFHYSELVTDRAELELGDEVQYIETKKSYKRSAEKVTKVLATFKQDVLPKVYDGIVIRPMRIVDPEQEEYEGLVQVTPSNNDNKQQEDDQDEKVATTMNEMYRFGITSMLEKKEALNVGDKISFQLSMDPCSKKKRAVNISCKRSLIRGKIESIKGQFGFIAFDMDKSVFFHMSEVQQDHGKLLKPGDDVCFVVVQNHKNAKKSAVRVQKIVDERPEHLTRRRSQRFSESSTNKLTLLRQPSGPDGSKGFQHPRASCVQQIEEQVSAIDITS